MKTFFKIAASLGLASGGVYFYYGGLKPLDIREDKLDGQIFLYRDLGNDKGSRKPKILNKLKTDLTDLGTTSYVMTSVFYNDSKLDKASRSGPKGHERLVVGAMLDPSQENQVKQFIAKHPEYHVVGTKDMDILTAKFPYRGFLSLYMMNFRDVYSMLMKFGREKKGLDSDTSYFVEQYSFANGKNDFVKIMVPYGKNMKQLDTAVLPVSLKGGPVGQLIG